MIVMSFAHFSIGTFMAGEVEITTFPRTFSHKEYLKEKKFV